MTINAIGLQLAPWMEAGYWGTYYEIGEEPQHEIIYKVGRTYFCHCMSRGAMGIVLSHLSILQHAYDAGYETIWVMEDDIEVIRNPHLLSSYITQLDDLVGKEGWDILFTDQDSKNGRGEHVTCWGYCWRPDFSPE